MAASESDSSGSSLGFSPPTPKQTDPTENSTKLQCNLNYFRRDLTKSSKISPDLVSFPPDLASFDLFRDLARSGEISTESSLFSFEIMIDAAFLSFDQNQSDLIQPVEVINWQKVLHSATHWNQAEFR